MNGAERRHYDGLSWLERAGTGPVCVCLHGIGGTAQSFDAMTAHLPRTWRVIAWDAPGYGASHPLADDWPDADTYAAALDRLLDAAGVGRAIVLGHSLGTLIGAAFAARYPDRVATLVLAAAAQGYGVARGSPLPDGIAARLAALAADGPMAFAEARAARLVHAPEANAAVVARVAREMARVRPRGYGQAARLLAGGDLAGTLARVRAPVGFILGAHDTITPRAQTDAAAAAWQAATGRTPPVTIVDGAGHALHAQAPEATAQAVAAVVGADAPVPATGEHHA